VWSERVSVFGEELVEFMAREHKPPIGAHRGARATKLDGVATRWSGR
jgi:hypothetical protein